MPIAIIAGALRSLPRLTRDLRGPLPDIANAPDDAEPMVHVVPNDDGLFTWSLVFPEEPPSDDRPRRRRTA